MPVGREHGLHLVGAILDGLVPTDAAMRGAEGRHGLDELVDLGIQKRVMAGDPGNLRDLQKNKIPYIVEPLTGTSSQVLYTDERFL